MIFVDDEDMIREYFPQILDFTQYDFSLDAALGSAEQAITYLREHPEVQVVITDIKMGRISGLDFCEQAHEIYPNMVFVILTGFRDFRYAQRAIRADVFDYLVKPTSMSDLKEILKHLKAYLDEKYRQNPPSGANNPKYRNIVGMMMQLAKQHYTEGYSLEDAAEAIGMNAAYLSRMFSQKQGMTYSDYILSLKVERAKELLADPTIKVYEVSDAVGYRNLQHFYKIFKKITGMTPSEYREARHISGLEESTEAVPGNDGLETDLLQKK